jgi:phosphotransferase system enzyme I (PtsI)
MAHEENPAMGLRAIRISLRAWDLFRTQLRAILRASAFGKILVMFPMISSVREFKAAKAGVEKVKAELKAEGKSFDENIKIGMMVETPAAAVLADDFAKEAAFFSIGANDLTQYTLAVDRGNTGISDLYDNAHPAVLRLVKRTIDCAHAAGIPCYMCGELAAREDTLKTLYDWGLDEFSMSAGNIARVKNFFLHTKPLRHQA